MTSIRSGSLAREHDLECFEQIQPQPTQATSEYEYKPLQASQIRLLTITSISSDGITCDLEQSEFDDCPIYDALSYAWGEQDSNRPTLHCNGRFISISPHLHSALERFYRAWENDDTSDRLPCPRIWVDAVCINQNDHVEKGHQVAKMAQIYACARRVIVWLGEHENASEIAIQFLQGYAIAFPDDRDESEMRYSVKDRLQLLKDQNKQTWSALIDLFDRPYFKRRWILQELASGKSVCLFCGGGSVTWSALAGLVTVSAQTDIFDKLEEADRTSFFWSFSVVCIRSLVAFRSSYSSMLQVFELAQRQRCTQKVDSLLSLIGILPQEYQAGSVAAGIYDYRQPYWAVFLRFVKSVLQFSLHPLALAGACKTRHPCLPSWCPDFTSKLFYMYSGESQFLAGSGKPVLGGYPTDQFLRCRGIQVGIVLDKVDGRDSPRHQGHYTQTESRKILSWERACRDLAQRASPCSEPELDDILSRVLTRDNYNLVPEAERREFWGKSYSLWKQAHWKNVVTGDSRPFSMSVVTTYDLSVLFSVEDTTFFATVQGRLGVSNSKIQPKDVVYVLYGGNAPFVLRPNPDDNTMQLIGDAYLDGVMYGEALTAENKMPDEWVTLR
ncbi:hypothetical protein XANCAGTX0491_001970 [Xanthoria calcicola]